MQISNCYVSDRRAALSTFLLIFGIAFFTLTFFRPALAQENTNAEIRSLMEPVDRDSQPVEVLVLGSFHFNQAPDFNDMGAPDQQKEIKEVVKSLERFSPDKIAVEFERKDTALVDSLYNTYRKGDRDLAINEREQIGFRLANRLGHQKVYPIDYKKPWGMNAVMKWAKKNNPSFVDYVNNWQRKSARLDSILQKNRTVGEILAVYNTDTFLDRVQRVRMRTIEVGADKNYVGIEPVSSVYKRNMRIFANLLSDTDPGDRVLIVYGAGHSYFFNSFINQHPGMELVNANRYLPSVKNILSNKGEQSRE